MSGRCDWQRSLWRIAASTSQRVGAKLLLVKPGALRSIWQKDVTPNAGRHRIAL